MKQLMGASVVGESGREILYWSGGYGFLLTTEVEPGFWKADKIPREEAVEWSRKKLSAAEFKETFAVA